MLCEAHSARCLVAYLYSAAGPGAIDDDSAWDGQASIYENGAEARRGAAVRRTAATRLRDVDLERMAAERMRTMTWGDCVDLEGGGEFRTVAFDLAPPLDRDIGLARKIARFPYVPDDDARLAELCYEAFNIQAHGLRQRLEGARTKKIVIGVSGGLDSTQALLVAGPLSIS